MAAENVETQNSSASNAKMKAEETEKLMNSAPRKTPVENTTSNKEKEEEVEHHFSLRPSDLNENLVYF